MYPFEEKGEVMEAKKQGTFPSAPLWKGPQLILMTEHPGTRAWFCGLSEPQACLLCASLADFGSASAAAVTGVSVAHARRVCAALIDLRGFSSDWVHERKVRGGHQTPRRQPAFGTIERVVSFTDGPKRAKLSTQVTFEVVERHFLEGLVGDGEVDASDLLGRPMRIRGDIEGEDFRGQVEGGAGVGDINDAADASLDWSGA